MATNSQSLLTAANCYAGFGDNSYMLRLMKLALLNQIATGVTLATDPQSLLTQAKCFACMGDNGYMLQLMELALLAQISANGTGGAPGGGVTAGTGAPSSTPTSSGALYIQTDSIPAGQIWEWYSGAWH